MPFLKKTLHLEGKEVLKSHKQCANLPLVLKEHLHRHDCNKFSHQFTTFICIGSGLDVHSGESIGNARCAIMFSCTMLRKYVKMLVIMVFGVLNSVFPSPNLYILHCKRKIKLLHLLNHTNKN